MQIDIRLDNDHTGNDVRALARWLRSDEDLLSARVQEIEGDAGPDEMGPIAEIVQIATEPEVIAAVITSIGAWLTTRSKTTRVRMKNGDKEVEVEGPGADDPQELADDLMNRLNES